MPLGRDRRATSSPQTWGPRDGGGYAAALTPSPNTVALQWGMTQHTHANPRWEHPPFGSQGRGIHCHYFGGCCGVILPPPLPFRPQDSADQAGLDIRSPGLWGPYIHAVPTVVWPSEAIRSPPPPLSPVWMHSGRYGSMYTVVSPPLVPVLCPPPPPNRENWRGEIRATRSGP